MLAFCNVYFKTHHWKDYEKYTPKESHVLRDRRVIQNNYVMQSTQQNIYLKALNKSNWFGGDDHETFWGIVQTLVQDIKGEFGYAIWGFFMYFGI